MKLKEGLTKENFWNKMNERFPKGMKTFCNWIDEYKKAVDWKDIFEIGEYESVFVDHQVKFHDLPYAMQLGIWIEFCKQQQFNIDNPSMHTFQLEDSIKEYLSWKEFQNT